MAFTYSMKRIYSQGGDGLSSTENLSDALSLEISQAIAANQTNLAIALTMDVSQLKAVYILCDQDITLNFNGHSAPAPQILLKANVAYEWSSTGYLVNLLTTDITGLEITNTTACQLEMRFLYHT